MASPARSFLAQAQSKTSGTTLATGASGSATFAAGDVICVFLAMDPAAGTVSFALDATTGPNFGSFTTQADISQGSGTSGVRLVVATASCTTGFTGTPNVTATFPTCTAKMVQADQITGCDATTPVRG